MKDEAQSGYKPAQDEVLKTLGLAVIASNSVERLMSTCLTYALNGKPLQTVEQLHALLRRHDIATLGQLLKALRQRYDLHPTFDGQLARFLDSRNTIAHRLHDVPGGLDLHSDEGRMRLLSFLLQYMEDGERISMVFLGIMREWARQADIDLPGENHLSLKMQDHLDSSVVPALEMLISARSTQVPTSEVAGPVPAAPS